MSVAPKRSSMTFFSNNEDHYSHRVRLVLAEKGVTYDLLAIDPDNKPEELADINPYNSLPTLLDRDLALYESMTMMEYLDERFPHPPLLPVFPVDRALSRLWVHRIEKEWSPLVEVLATEPGSKKAEKARKNLRESIIGVAPIFEERPFFMSEEFSLVDCCVLPILWRLQHFGIELPEKQVQPLIKYMDKCFQREGFIASLSEVEREMRP